MGRNALLLSCVLVLACGDDDGAMDAGADATADVSDDTTVADTGTDAPGDGGTDSALDAPIDAPTDVPTDAPAPRQTRITAILPTGAISLLAQFEDGMPALMQTGVAHDHEAPPGEDIFASRGSELYRATMFTATNIIFGDERPLVDGGGASAEPSIFFSGELAAGVPTMAGVFGSTARVYDFTAMSFGDPVLLRETGDVEFTPSSATFVNPGGGTIVLFLKEGDSQIWFLNTATGTIDALVQPIQCSDDSSINPDLILGASLPGLAPPGVADALAVVQGSDIFLLEEIAPAICFSDAIPLTDGGGASLAPDIAFGWDFNDDGTDNVILVDTVEIPTL